MLGAQWERYNQMQKEAMEKAKARLVEQSRQAVPLSVPVKAPSVPQVGALTQALRENNRQLIQRSPLATVPKKAPSGPSVAVATQALAQNNRRLLKQSPLLAVQEQASKQEQQRISRRARVDYLIDPARKLTAGEKQEAKQIAAQYDKDLRGKFFALKRSKEDLQKLADVAALEAKYKGTTQFGLGMVRSFGGEYFNDKAEEAVEKNEALRSALPQTVNTYESARVQNPLAFGAGVIGGEALKYGTSAKALSKIPAFGKLRGSEKVASRLAAGRLVDLPVDVVNAAMEADSPEEFWGRLGTYQALGLITHGGFEGIGALYRAARASGKAAVSAGEKSGQVAAPILPKQIQKDGDIYKRITTPKGELGVHNKNGKASYAVWLEPKSSEAGVMRPSTGLNAEQIQNTRTQAKGARLTQADNLERYKAEVNGVFSGGLKSGEDVILGQTPQVLVDNGAPNLLLRMAQTTVRKIAYPSGYLGLKHGHNLGLSALKNLPHQLEDPLAIISNPQANRKGLESYLILTNWLDEQGHRIVSAVHMNDKGAIELQNTLATTFQAKYLDDLLSKPGVTVKYTKNNEDIDRLLSTGNLYPKAMADDVFVSRSITHSKGNIKEGASAVHDNTFEK